jgi:N-acetylglucosaminyldiphosphoundecaprenol N-acetyl-beta-D-mannosaminyltransferase
VEAAVDSSDRSRGGTTARLSILSVRLDLNTRAQVESIVDRFLSDPWDGVCRHIVTLNPEYVMAAQRSPGFRQSIEDSDLVVADGVGVVIAAKLFDAARSSNIERFTGVELVDLLGEQSGIQNARLFLLGGEPGIAVKAADELRRRHPNAKIAGAWGEGTADPAFDFATLDKLAASSAGAIAVAYGAPNQLFWIDRNKSDLTKCGVRVAIGVGGAFDYLAGTAPMAPEIVRRIGLEWLYRLIRQPWRWRRQLVLPVFAIRIVISWLWTRGNRGHKVAKPK